MVKLDSFNLVTDIRVLWRSLGQSERRRFYGLFALSIVSSASEVLSIGAIIPFLAVVAVPDQLTGFPLVTWLLQVTGVQNQSNLTVTLGLFFGFAVLLACVVRWYLVAACAHFSNDAGCVIGQIIFKRALSQPYAFHILRHSSDLHTVVTAQVEHAVSAIFMSGLRMLVSVVMLVLIFSALVWLNPGLVLIVFAGFAAIYLLIYRLSRYRLSANSEQLAQADSARHKILQEAMGALRDIYVNHAQATFTHAFQKADEAFYKARSETATISYGPRYLVEGIGTVFIVLVMLTYSVTMTQELTSILPMMGALVMAAQRVLPMLQHVYSGWTQIRGVTHSRQIVCQWLEGQFDGVVSPSIKEAPRQQTGFDCQTQTEPFQGLTLKSIGFRYQGQSTRVLQDINFSLKAGQSVGICGPSGVGKSTLLDVVMGLLEPTEGRVLINGKPLSGFPFASTMDTTSSDSVPLEQWHNQIAHVSQHVFLLDDTVANNIVFGQPHEKIDPARLRHAIEDAQLTDVIEQLPQGLESRVGERGVRLSGGERQRIGVARALYKTANLLVLDEVTSALDGVLQQRMVRAIADTRRHMAILVVSHRPLALASCDVIYQLSPHGLVALPDGMASTADMQGSFGGHLGIASEEPANSNDHD